MLNLITLLIKVTLSLIATYVLIFYSKTSKNNNELFKYILLSSLLISSFLCILFLISNHANDFTVFIGGLLICSSFLYLISKDFDTSIQFDLYFIFFLSAGISAGYLLHSLIIFCSYFYIKNNFETINFKHEDKDNESFMIDDNE